MSRRAKLRIRDLGEGIRRFEVDCPRATTGITQVPGLARLDEPELIAFAAPTHDERCGRCDIRSVLAEAERQCLTGALAEGRN